MKENRDCNFYNIDSRSIEKLLVEEICNHFVRERQRAERIIMRSIESLLTLKTPVRSEESEI